ncbi:MAG: hypothetical protein EP326_14270 [Deltaproteobacteria bacterium]|nr:MAG: hypothetical protein EP326_14270 [Deltaproteobacteria bacterium]
MKNFASGTINAGLATYREQEKKKKKAETKRAPLDWNKDQKAIAVVDTPNMATIEDVCNFLKAPQHHSLKSLVYKGITGDKETFILAMLLGDDELNEIKLGAYLKSDHVMAATDNELKELQLEKGFIGPYSLKKEIKVVFDAEINLDASYVTGANQADKHFEGFVPSRDIKGYEVADLRQAKVGDLDKESGKPVYTKRGIEAGHIFQLGDKYTKSMNVSVLDQNGKTIHPLMGCYGMGITRVVAASIEQNHDEKGIVWPVSIAPADLHFVVIAKGDETQVQADKIYESLMKAGVDVVYDDRKAGPGFKFKDADLLGLPFQLVLGERDFKEDGMLKINRRKDGASIKVKPEEVIDRIQELLAVQLVLEDNTIQDKPADPFGA